MLLPTQEDLAPLTPIFFLFLFESLIFARIFEYNWRKPKYFNFHNFLLFFSLIYLLFVMSFQICFCLSPFVINNLFTFTLLFNFIFNILPRTPSHLFLILFSCFSSSNSINRYHLVAFFYFVYCKFN